MRTGELNKNDHLAYVTINGNLPDSDGNFSGIATGENFTLEDKEKLSTLEPSGFIGKFDSFSELETIQGETNQFAYVDEGVGNQISIYIWDDNDNVWIPQKVTSTTPTALEIANLYESNPDVERFTTEDKSKLDTLENFNPATLDSKFNLKVDKIEGKGLSTNDFTTLEKEKLNGLEGPKFRGEFTSLEELKVIVGSVGEYAYVDLGAGSTVEKYIWDTTDEDWIMQQGESNLMTPTQIKNNLDSIGAYTLTEEQIVNVDLIPVKQDISISSEITASEAIAGLNLLDNVDYLITEAVSEINITSAIGSLSLQFTCGGPIMTFTLPENTGWGCGLPLYVEGKIYNIIFFRGSWYIDEGR